MKQRGQIFTLDFVISIILVTLAFGIMFSYMEISEYFMKDSELIGELELVGTVASDALVSSPGIVCQVSTNLSPSTLINGFYLDNCLQQDKISSYAGSFKAGLGIPAGYECFVSSPKIEFPTVGGCNGNPALAENIFDANRTVVFSAGPLKKDKFDSCVNGGACPLAETTVSLKVWRA